MGLQDRDYMRRRPHEARALGGFGAREQDERPANWRSRLFVAGCLLAAAGAAFWLLRDVVRAPVATRAPVEEARGVNINSATQEQLESVPGIGPALAGRIIAGRPYESVDDLLRVSGIGERTLESMRPLLTTGGAVPR
jgi:competence ComEA-like helix-hairpin-helix protein